MKPEQRGLCFAVLLSFLLGLASPTVTGQVRPALHEQVRVAVVSDEIERAVGLLREISTASPKSFTANNYDYLLARLFMRQGKNTEARPLLEQVLARNGVLSPYALLHLAEMSRVEGQYASEQKLLDQLLVKYPSFIHRRTVVQRLGASYLRTSKYALAISTLLPLSSTRGSTGRESLGQVGAAQVALGQTAFGRKTFESLLAGGMMDDGALRAVTELDQLDEKEKVSLTEVEHLRRARIYQFNRIFAGARKHWLAIVEIAPPSASRREALFNLGRGYFLELNYNESMRYYQRVHDEFPDSEEGEQGFYYVGHCHQALFQTEKAIARYEEFIRNYPRSDYFGYAFLNAIDTLRIAGKLDEAAKWATRAEMESKEPFIVTRAIFDRAKIRMTQGAYNAALADLNALLGRNLAIRGRVATTSPVEVSFMRALCYEQLGRFEDAVSTYLGMTESRSEIAGYYGYQATARLRALASNARSRRLLAARLDSFVQNARNAAASGDAQMAKLNATQALRLTESAEMREEMLRIIRDAYAKLPAYKLPTLVMQPAGRQSPVPDGSAAARSAADELLFLGLYDEGASELVAERPPDRTPAGHNWAFTIAVACARGNCPDRTLKFAEPILSALPSDYRLELLPRDLAEMFYPLSFRDSMSRHAGSRDVDPRFVLSIARQESRYDPEVKSSAAARGLLQFIASTSDQIAAELKLTDFDQNDLYGPDTAILIGSQYIRNLFDEFKTPQAAAAAYNGSEDSVRRWLARAQSSDVDRFVLEVAKGQTKDYVFKVMNNYRAYQAIYPSLGVERGTSAEAAKPAVRN
jgi:soluble lytic murein transglycosylase